MSYRVSPAAQRSVDRRLRRDRLDTFLLRLERGGGSPWERGTWLFDTLWAFGLIVRPPHSMPARMVFALHSLPGLLVTLALHVLADGLTAPLAAVLVSSSLWCGVVTASHCRDTAERLDLPSWDDSDV